MTLLLPTNISGTLDEWVTRSRQQFENAANIEQVSESHSLSLASGLKRANP